MGLLVRPALLRKAAGGSGATGYRYYRIEGNAQYYSFENYFIQVSEIQLRLSSGGADQCSGGTVSAIGEQPGFPVGNSVDNDIDTFWGYQTTSDNLVWWQYDFGAGNSKDITHVHLTPRQGTYSTPVYPLCFTDFTVKGSNDGSSWTTLATNLKSGGWSSESGEEFEIQ